MYVSLLGTGLMGAPMAERLLQFGHVVSVYNRTSAKTEQFKKLNIHIATSSAEAIKKSECVLLTLSDMVANEEVLFTDDADFTGKTFIQMGTLGPGQSIALQKKIYKKGGEYFECPVLGSRKEAASGTLILLVGSTQEKFDHWKSFLESFGNPRRIGEIGKAAAIKLALNQLIASHAVAFSLSLGIVKKNGIEVDQFSHILRESALIAPMYEKKLNNWVQQNYANPNFPAKHLLKDVNLILDEAKDKDLSVDSLNAIRALYEKTIEKGLSEEDYSVIFEVINNP